MNMNGAMIYGIKGFQLDKGDGKIFIGDTLHLPHTLELTYRDKTTKTISMKK